MLGNAMINGNAWKCYLVRVKCPGTWMTSDRWYGIFMHLFTLVNLAIGRLCPIALFWLSCLQISNIAVLFENKTVHEVLNNGHGQDIFSWRNPSIKRSHNIGIILFWIKVSHHTQNSTNTNTHHRFTSFVVLARSLLWQFFKPDQAEN